PWETRRGETTPWGNNAVGKQRRGETTPWENTPSDKRNDDHGAFLDASNHRANVTMHYFF
ncbi:MAG: hypothetical protein ABSB70_23135, partial [Candidatus Velthaea sp.]